MLVLDTIRTVQAGRISIPPFHNGHLGFLPGTVVSLTALAGHTRDDPGNHDDRPQPGDCVEVIVTPFRQEVQKMARLVCVLQDRPGAVRALASAVADLGVNIGVQESGSINAFGQHVISMILSWSASNEYGQDVGELATAETIERYQSLRRLFPVDEKRYVKLFESIVVNCADYLVGQDTAGVWLPDIRLQPIHETRPRADLGSAVIERARKKWFVSLPVPEELTNYLAGHLDATEDAPLKYIVLSDPYQRAARIVFLSDRFSRRLVSVGFHMRDRPGALAATLEIIADAGFNIITSTHRRLRTQESRSVWDVLLQCPKHAIGPRAKVDARVVLTRLRRAVQHVRRLNPSTVAALQKCEVALGTPQFPTRRRSRRAVELVSASTRFQRQPATGPKDERERDRQNLVKARRLLQRKDPPRAYEVLRMVRDELALPVRKPTIFLSYPRAASDLGRVVKTALGREGYGIDDYQVNDGEVILKQVGRKIRACAFFIGLWHRDPGKGLAVSPWLPYELGLAVAWGKQTHVVYDRALPQYIRDRIGRDIANVTYDKGSFRRKTVPAIVEYCRKHFVKDTAARTPRS